jgi:hypothetical protein
MALSSKKNPNVIFNETPKYLPWSRTRFVKLIVAQLVKNFCAFYGTRRFIILYEYIYKYMFTEPPSLVIIYLIHWRVV